MQNPGNETVAQSFDQSDETISLWPMILTLWSRRRFLVQAMAIALAVYLAGAVGFYLRASHTKTANLQFRLAFEGIDKGVYPNGIRFSPTDIVATPVVSQVYEANNVKQYLSFPAFKNAFVVTQASAELFSLEEDYRGKLADSRLTFVDRDRLQREYNSKKEAASVSDYQLRFVRNEGFGSMPNQLVEKILNDVLTDWAQDAAEKRGVLKYQIPIFTRNVIQKDEIAAEDFIVAIDIVRNHVLRITRMVDTVSTLPGANVLRVGKQQIALPDLRIQLDDLLRFKINPMLGMVRYLGLSKDPVLTSRYLEAQMMLVNLDRQAAQQKAELYQSSLRTYLQQERTTSSAANSGAKAEGGGSGLFGGTSDVPAILPQLGDSFFDRLIAMGSKTEEAKFKQDIMERTIKSGESVVDSDKDITLYKDLVAEMKRIKVGQLSEAQARFIPIFQARFEQWLSQIVGILDQVNLIYETSSKQNLNPASQLFRVLAPVQITQLSSITMTTAYVVTATYFLVTFIGLVVYCLFRERFHEVLHAVAERRQSSTTAAGSNS
jgi:hypothetical protein